MSHHKDDGRSLHTHNIKASVTETALYTVRGMTNMLTDADVQSLTVL